MSHENCSNPAIMLPFIKLMKYSHTINVDSRYRCSLTECDGGSFFFRTNVISVTATVYGNFKEYIANERSNTTFNILDKILIFEANETANK